MPYGPCGSAIHRCAPWSSSNSTNAVAVTNTKAPRSHAACSARCSGEGELSRPACAQSNRTPVAWIATLLTECKVEIERSSTQGAITADSVTDDKQCGFVEFRHSALAVASAAGSAHRRVQHDGLMATAWIHWHGMSGDWPPDVTATSTRIAASFRPTPTPCPGLARTPIASKRTFTDSANGSALLLPMIAVRSKRPSNARIDASALNSARTKSRSSGSSLS